LFLKITAIYPKPSKTLTTITDEKGDPWFVAKDACMILGLTNSREAVSVLDASEKNTVRISDGIQRGNPNKTIISEAGLYRLIMRSNKPDAIKFQMWIAHDVLPQIRKTGGCIPVEEGMSDTEVLARAFMIAQRTIDEESTGGLSPG
jgi:anti-repressor protein